MRWVPEVVELYHSMMHRDSRREPGGRAPNAVAASTRDMIEEIGNRFAHLFVVSPVAVSLLGFYEIAS